MFTLEVDYGSCGGGCRDCKLSNASGRTPSNTYFSEEQREIVKRVVHIFGKEEKCASLSFAQCLSMFDSGGDFVDTGADLPVVELLLYVDSHEADLESIIRGTDIFLSRYPLAYRVLFSFFRGRNNVRSQQLALQRIVPDFLRFLKSKKQIKNFNIAFGANDIQDMRTFTPLQRDFSRISELNDISPVVSAIQDMNATKIGDVLEFPSYPLEKFRRRTLSFALPQERKFSLGLYRDKNNLRSLSATSALSIVGNAPRPNFHISPTHTFLYHHPLLSRIPGIQVRHEYVHELLDFYEKGNPWPQLVQGSILRHFM